MTVAQREFMGHPYGLVFLGGTEFWDRISFYGMQALLVLYMAERLLLPGHVEHVAGMAGFRAAIEFMTGPLSIRALSSQVFGLYVGLVYLSPVIGGALGDRALGRRRAVTLGAVMMTAGHLCMAFERWFLIALLLLILGAGLLRGNLASQLGSLYGAGDSRRSNGFQIYYIILNLGSFFAPLVTGTLASRYGWPYGFGFAGLGMLVGLLIYASASRCLPADPPRHSAPRRRLTAGERRITAILILILPVLTLFWVAQAQIWDTYNLWARDHVNLMVGSFHMPVPWLQSVDALGAIVLVPPILRLWRWQRIRGTEPDDLAKLGIGCVLFGAAVLWLSASQWVSTSSGVPLAWVISYHFLSSVGYIYFAPVAIAFYSRTAPAAINAAMIGVYYLSIFIGSTASGRLGGLYERLSSASFWLLHAAIVGMGGVLLLMLAPLLRREFGSGEQRDPGMTTSNEVAAP